MCFGGLKIKDQGQVTDWLNAWGTAQEMRSAWDIVSVEDIYNNILEFEPIVLWKSASFELSIDAKLCLWFLISI